MRRTLSISLVCALASSALIAQVPSPPPPPPDANTYAVTYVDIRPSGRDAAVAAFRQYVRASAAEDGRIRIDVLEQIGRPAHFVVVERWADAKAMQAHSAAPGTRRLLEALQPIRLTGYDERTYITLSTTPAVRAGGRAIAVVSHVDTVPTPGRNPPVMLREFAEVSRRDEGNLRFDVMQQAARRGHFTVFEVWRDRKALEAHAAAAHTTQFRETATPMTGSPLDERWFRIVE